nr:hypothetical protein [Tanacetum cinerariifolium]
EELREGGEKNMSLINNKRMPMLEYIRIFECQYLNVASVGRLRKLISEWEPQMFPTLPVDLDIGGA